MDSQGWLRCLGGMLSGSPAHPQSGLAPVPRRHSQWEPHVDCLLIQKDLYCIYAERRSDVTEIELWN